MQNMWACILNFEISLIKISLLNEVPSYQSSLVCFFFYQSISLYHFVQLPFFRICSIPLILIIACFLCCLQWPFTGGIGKKRQEREKERKENPIAEDQEKAEKVKKRQKGQEEAERKGEVKRRLFQSFKKMQEWS